MGGEEREKIDYATNRKWFGWVKILALALIVVIAVGAFLLFQAIMKLL